MAHGKTILLALLSVAIAILSYLVPKKSGTIAFYPTFTKRKFSGNAAAVFQELRRQHPNIECIWLTQDQRTHEDLASNGFRSVLYSYAPIWTLLRSDFIVIDNLVAYLAFGRLRILQLWHGTGFKHIALQNSNRKGLIRLIHKAHYNRYELIIASSEEDRRRKAECFENPRVYITGSPRNDIFFKDKPNEEAKKRLGLSSFKRIITYCPTFREGTNIPPFSQSFLDRMQVWLAESQTALIIKKHPADKRLTIPQGYKNILDLSEQVQDIQAFLLLSDILISDYSGIVTDFALTHRPIIFYVYDLTEYISTSRSFYYDLTTILPGPFAHDENALLEKLMDISWFQESNYKDRYQQFLDTFHNYIDGNASERTSDLIARIIHEPS